ncbi:pentapeptide repeat-containing protein [Nocardia sp. NPDC058666]|uniref:pentapeptide repeat-containing protein n=1 Tax=Nocardia sp. NPDC058666 TaxID=3346587 RepID=UPI00365A2DF2
MAGICHRWAGSRSTPRSNSTARSEPIVRFAPLSGTNLTGANLTGANLAGIIHDARTVRPTDFTPA